MRKTLLFIVLAVVIQACGTSPYTPSQYPLREGLIPPIDAAGPVLVTNAQPSTSPVIVYSYGGSKLQSDLKTITETMVQQTNGELAKYAKVRPNGKPKTIALKVDSLLSTYVVFSWKSDIVFHATLGNGKVIDMSVHHASGVLLQDLNGCIAEGVYKFLNNEQVRAYLAE